MYLPAFQGFGLRVLLLVPYSKFDSRRFIETAAIYLSCFGLCMGCQ